MGLVNSVERTQECPFSLNILPESRHGTDKTEVEVYGIQRQILNNSQKTQILLSSR